MIETMSVNAARIREYEFLYGQESGKPWTGLWPFRNISIPPAK